MGVGRSEAARNDVPPNLLFADVVNRPQIGPDFSASTPQNRFDLTTPIWPDPTIEIQPEAPAPGDRVELRFPGNDLRGLYFRLEQRVGNDWEMTHFLISHLDRAGPTAASVDQAIMLADVGVGGPGPDVVVLPEEMPTGEWRICTRGPAPVACGEFGL